MARPAEPPQAAEIAGLEQVFLASPVPIYEIDAEGVVLRWNPACETVFGWSAAEAVGRRLPHVPDDQQASFDALRAAVLSGRPAVEERITRVRADGRRIELSLSSSAVESATGGPATIVAVACEITGQVRLERDLRATTAEVLGMAKGLAELVDAAPVAIWELAADDSRVLRWNPAAARLFGLHVDEIVGQVCPCAALAPSKRDRVLAGEAFAGVRTTRTRPDGSEVAVALSAAPVRDAHGAVDRILCVAQDVSAQARAEAELRASEAQYRAVLHGISDALYVLEPHADGTYRYAFVNPGYTRLTGRVATDVLGRRLADVLPGATAADSEGHVTAAIEARRMVEVEQTTLIGEREVHVVKRLTPVFDDEGTPLRVIVAMRDVTDTIEAATRLRFAAHLLDEIPIAVVACDANLVTTHWNAFAEQLSGASAADVVGRPLADVLVPAARDPQDALALVESARQGRKWRGEVDARLPDGSHVPLEVHVLPLFGPEGAYDGAILVSTDLRERRAAEDALRESRERIELILDSITDAFYALDGERRFTYVNAEAEHLLRLPASELIGRPLCEVFPEVAGTLFESEYSRATREQVPVFFEEFYAPLDAWFDVHAYPSADGLSVYFRDVTEQKRDQEQIAFLAYNDDLTGLPNRTRFTQELELAITRAEGTGDPVAVLYVDLDDFKLVNDSLGHAVGDEFLQRVAARLRRATREADLIARQGGDEFLLLIGDLHDTVGESVIEQAERLGARVQEALTEPFVLDGVELFASASVGVSVYPHDAKDADSLLKHADTAMYEAKKDGRGRSRVYRQTGADPLAQLSLANRLRRAVDREEFVLHWQPIVNLLDGGVMGAEALVRWLDPERGLILPGAFISLAEDTGLIERIGDWVVHEFCRQSSEWARQGLDLQTEFNLSLRQLWQPNIVGRLVGAVDAAGLDPSRVVVEVTESAAMTDPERALRIFRDLHAHGLKLAIDDFGTGYSSLSRLTQLPVQFVKIDRSFVRDVADDDSAATMVTLLMQLAEGLSLTPIAEGIETAAQWQFLVQHGCAQGQGFLFGRPVPASEFTVLARDTRSAA